MSLCCLVTIYDYKYLHYSWLFPYGETNHDHHIRAKSSLYTISMNIYRTMKALVQMTQTFYILGPDLHNLTICIIYPTAIICEVWLDTTLTLSQCTLAGPVYTGMPLECRWLTQCTLGYHWATKRIFAGYTGTPLEKLSWNSPTLECHWRNLVESTPHWDATGETLTFAAYTGTPLEGLWQPTHAPTHIVKHAE